MLLEVGSSDAVGKGVGVRGGVEEGPGTRMAFFDKLDDLCFLQRTIRRTTMTSNNPATIAPIIPPQGVFELELAVELELELVGRLVESTKVDEGDGMNEVSMVDEKRD
jgi:hypothetical protein